MGVRGYKDFNINWLGWYGNDAKIQLDLKNSQVQTIRLNFLEDQRHWIFVLLNITIYGRKDEEKIKIETFKFPELTENYEIEIISKTFKDQNLSNFTSFMIEIMNHRELPAWQKRNNKQAMFMIDEIEIY